MKLSAALEYENIRRNPADWNKIYLNHDGKFFHAYEWSAWLIKAVACTEEFQQQRGDAKMLSAMLYTTKNSEYVITGFPLDSIGKYIPQYVSMNQAIPNVHLQPFAVENQAGGGRRKTHGARPGFSHGQFTARSDEPLQQLQPSAGDIHARPYTSLWHLRPRHDDIHAE